MSQHAGIDADQTLATINKRTGRNMLQATGTGIVLFVMVLVCLALGETVFAILVTIFAMLAIWELRVDFATAGIRIPTIALWIASIVMACGVTLYSNRLVGLGIATACALPLVAVAASLNLVFSRSRVGAAVEAKILSSASIQSGKQQEYHVTQHTNVFVSLFALLYVPLLASLLIMNNHGSYGVIHACFMLFLPSLGDIGGLTVGAWIGKHKLSPRISPKKSVEGLIGSIVFATVGALVIAAIGYGFTITIHRVAWFIILGVLVAIVGLFGDLCASMIKRDLGLKDMGHLLKGHGGVLDRIDSIVISAPVVALWIAITGL